MAEPAPSSIAGLLKTAMTELAKTSPSAALDAEVLLCHCLQKERSFLRAWPEYQPAPRPLQIFWRLIARRAAGEPIAYLTGHREFWSRDFIVTADVLIPRPDSELLIECCLERIPVDRPCKIADLGTGSGILAITLAAERHLADVLAIDQSLAALEIARLNGERLAHGNVRFRHGNWLEGLSETGFDLIVSNPPYIAADDPHLQQGDVRFEPVTALVSAEQGLLDITTIVAESRRHLINGGQLLIEHGYNQQPAVQAIFNRHGYHDIVTHPDLSGNPRVTSAFWSPA